MFRKVVLPKLIWIGLMLVIPFLLIQAFLAVVRIHPGLFFNWSASAPVGLWRTADPEGATLTLGQWVAVCPSVDEDEAAILFEESEAKSDCPTKVLLKQVAAMPGDSVTVDDGAIVAPLTEVRAFKSHLGRKLPTLPNGKHRVDDDQYWVLADHHPLSVDSRYFGPVNRNAIFSLAEPAFTFNLR